MTDECCLECGNLNCTKFDYQFCKDRCWKGFEPLPRRQRFECFNCNRFMLRAGLIQR
jgi:hypothetical protein